MFKSVFSKIIILFILVTLVAGFVTASRAPAAATPAQPRDVSIGTLPLKLAWPATGQAAIGASGYGLLATHGNQAPVSIASVSKIITALAVLKDKPLAVGEQGPTITISQTDFDSYNNYYLHGGSVAQVAVGEQISEYQALEAMLLPSANNMADTLARWSFGSLDAYTAYADKMVESMGLGQTTVGGASGFNDRTLSTAADLVRVGQAAMDNPVIAKIVGEEQARIPVAGMIRNVNWLLGEDGVIGIKTGNTDNAGGCYLFASQRNINGQKVTVIGAILAAPTLNASMVETRNLLATVDANFRVVHVIKKGDVLASYHTPWGASAEAVAGENASLLVWNGSPLKAKNDFHSLGVPAAKGSGVGTVTISSNDKSMSIPAVLAAPINGPSLSWRLRHF